MAVTASPPSLLARKRPRILRSLIAYAERFGLGLGAYRIAPEELLLAEEFPLFLVYAREGKTHMRLLLRVRRGRYCAYDPIEGVKRGKKEELLEGFSGVFLRVERDSGGRSEAQRSVLPLSLRLFPTLFSVLAMAFFLAGSLTLGSTLPFWVPLASLAIGVSFMLLFASSSYWGMKRFDEAFQGRIRDEDPSRRQEKFRLFHAYKQKVFGRGMGGLFPCFYRFRSLRLWRSAIWP